VISRRPPVAGQNLGLTIDKKLQLTAEKCLKDKRGSIVALHPMTGEILAMASNPAFDPNLFLEGLNRTEWVKLVTSKDHPFKTGRLQGNTPRGPRLRS